MKNPKYIYNKSINSKIGNKWSLKAYKNFCEENNLDFEMIMKEIKDKVIKTLLSIYSIFTIKIKNMIYDRKFHNLYGFDFFLDDKLKLFLLEVNDGPSLDIYDNLDKDIKTKLKADTLNLIGIFPFSHDSEQKPLDEVFPYDNIIEESIDYSLCEYARPKGDYERIFPVKGHIKKYKKFFPKISRVDELLWNKINEIE